MKNECNIIGDLLPLYLENLVSSDTKDFVDEHLENCNECRKKLQEMKSAQSAVIEPLLPTMPLKQIKRKLWKKRVSVICLTAISIIAIMITAFSYLTSPQYLPYSDDLLSLSVNEEGKMLITFNDEVSGYSFVSQEENGVMLYYVNASRTLWDNFSGNQLPREMILEPALPETPYAVYYTQNSSGEITISSTSDVAPSPSKNSTEDVLLAGVNPTAPSAVITLPRLTLNYYLFVAAIVFVVLFAGLLVFRKNQKAKRYLERMAVFPLAYLVAHLFIKGFFGASYSIERDLSLIFLVAILLCVAGQFGVSLYRARVSSSIKNTLRH